jgi:hypothetical protein
MDLPEEQDMPNITYHRLTPSARATIREQMPIAAFVRYFYPDGSWRGDVCGCPDDRCADGFHHGGIDYCGCLPVAIAEANAGSKAAA